MSKSKSVPPTVLVITLEADGCGSLLTRRGDLAHLSQFTYDGLPDIVAAIQQGATELITLEQNPPNVDTPQSAPIEASVEPVVAEAAEPVPQESAPQDEPETPSVEPTPSTFSQTQLM